MSLTKQIGPEFQAFDFTHDRRTYEVFRGGSGPAVLVLHEIPGCIRASSTSPVG